MAKRKRKRATTKRKKRATTKRKRSSRRKRRGGHLFTRASARASMGHCGKCGRTIFGGKKGMATHRRKSCGKKRRRKSRR